MSVVQKSARTTKIGGVTGAGFKPGQSGNPGGRPKGVARAVRHACGGSPSELARLLFEIANDNTARNADRIAATRELLDRGWGKAPAFAAVESHDPLEQDALVAEAARITAEIRASRGI
jgi:hypothetical protein